MKPGDRIYYNGARQYLNGKEGTVLLFPKDRHGMGFVRVNLEGFGHTECLIEHVKPIEERAHEHA